MGDKKRNDNNQLDVDTLEFNKRMGVTCDLNAPFKIYMQTLYTDSELSELLKAYEGVSHPLCNHITALLEATRDFRYATTTENYFEQSRDETLSDQALIAMLNNMAKALSDMNNIRDEYKTQEESTALTNTFNYSLGLIKQRINELNDIDDKIYHLIFNDVNELKKFL